MDTLRRSSEILLTVIITSIPLGMTFDISNVESDSPSSGFDVVTGDEMEVPLLSGIVLGVASGL